MHTPPPFRAELIEVTLQHAVAAAVGSPFLLSHERKHASVALQWSNAGTLAFIAGTRAPLAVSKQQQPEINALTVRKSCH